MSESIPTENEVLAALRVHGWNEEEATAGVEAIKRRGIGRGPKASREWLDRTQAVTDAATEGPWEVKGCEVVARDDTSPWPFHIALATATGDVSFQPEDAEFIAHARTALPLAVAALRKVQKVCDDWDQQERQLQADEGATSPHADRIRTTITETLEEGGDE